MIGLYLNSKFDVGHALAPTLRSRVHNICSLVDKRAKLLATSSITQPFHGGWYLLMGLIVSHCRPMDSVSYTHLTLPTIYSV